MKYQNPIILQDFSDPDVIRVGNDFYMVASSFNYMPGLPVLHSKNLVNWEIINYVFDRFPLAKYDEVHPGHGAWAPSIRYEDGVYLQVLHREKYLQLKCSQFSCPLHEIIALLNLCGKLYFTNGLIIFFTFFFCA